MNIATSSETLGIQGISDRLKLSIDKLISSSRHLQASIIARNVDQVWSILAEQQKLMQEFDRLNYLWKQVVVDSGLDSPQIRESKLEICRGIEELRRVGQGNASLVRSFLAAINRVFKKAADNVASKVRIYGKKGKMSGTTSSLLVNRLG